MIIFIIGCLRHVWRAVQLIEIWVAIKNVWEPLL